MLIILPKRRSIIPSMTDLISEIGVNIFASTAPPVLTIPITKISQRLTAWIIDHNVGIRTCLQYQAPDTRRCDVSGNRDPALRSSDQFPPPSGRGPPANVR